MLEATANFEPPSLFGDLVTSPYKPYKDGVETFIFTDEDLENMLQNKYDLSITELEKILEKHYPERLL